MRFTTKQDIEAPAAFVFKALSDFDGWERAAMRRGAEVERTDTLTQAGVGMSWKSRFSYRGRPRMIDLRVVTFDAPTQLAFAGQSPSVDGTAQVDMMEMSSQRTRIHVVAEVTPRTLAARLFLQSLRLARARVDRKFEQRVAQLAADVEQRFRSARAGQSISGFR